MEWTILGEQELVLSAGVWEGQVHSQGSLGHEE